jgi:hypothetical protein
VFTTAVPDIRDDAPDAGRVYAVSLKTCDGGWGTAAHDDATVVTDLYVEFSDILSRPIFANGEVYIAHDSGTGAPDIFNITLSGDKTRFRVVGTRIIN